MRTILVTKLTLSAQATTCSHNSFPEAIQIFGLLPIQLCNYNYDCFDYISSSLDGRELKKSLKSYPDTIQTLFIRSPIPPSNYKYYEINLASA